MGEQQPRQTGFRTELAKAQEKLKEAWQMFVFIIALFNRYPGKGVPEDPFFSQDDSKKE